MKPPLLALGTVLTTATTAYAGGPKIDASLMVGGLAFVAFVALNIAFYCWQRKS